MTPVVLPLRGGFSQRGGFFLLFALLPAQTEGVWSRYCVPAAAQGCWHCKDRFTPLIPVLSCFSSSTSSRLGWNCSGRFGEDSLQGFQHFPCLIRGGCREGWEGMGGPFSPLMNPRVRNSLLSHPSTKELSPLIQ